MKGSGVTGKGVITVVIALAFAGIALALFALFIRWAMGESDPAAGGPAAQVVAVSQRDRIADDVFVPYDRAQYPKLAAKVGERWEELQPLREEAAQRALAQPGCGKVSIAEISVDRSTREQLQAFVYCDDASVRIDFSEADLSPDPAVRARAEEQRKAELAQQEQDELWAIEMEDRVRAQLKDPDSARFRNTRTYHGGGVPVACGEVNSKNSFGGMGGFQRFVAAGDIIALDEQVEGGLQKLWIQFCKD